MKNDYWVVFSFHNKKNEASKGLTQIKKAIPDAYIEQDFDGGYVVTIGHFRTESEGLKAIDKAISKGYWGGFYTPKH